MRRSLKVFERNAWPMDVIEVRVCLCVIRTLPFCHSILFGMLGLGKVDSMHKYCKQAMYSECHALGGAKYHTH